VLVRVRLLSINNINRGRRLRPISMSNGTAKQEVQLLQRDRAMLRVIEYFAKSLKVTQGHSK